MGECVEHLAQGGGHVGVRAERDDGCVITQLQGAPGPRAVGWFENCGQGARCVCVCACVCVCVCQALPLILALIRSKTVPGVLSKAAVISLERGWLHQSLSCKVKQVGKGVSGVVW